jgi:50S ribosomal subunit-associated GTPase HflX
MTRERVLLVLIEFTHNVAKKSAVSVRRYSKDENIEELSNLALSAGADIGGILSYRQQKPNPKYFISSGRLENIKMLLEEDDIGLIIFDDEINPTQQRNLQRKLDIKKTYWKGSRAIKTRRRDRHQRSRRDQA